MAKTPPKRVTLRPDDYHAEHVGVTSDGRQFFVTNPFVPATDEHPGREFLALYLFDPAGTLLEARIDDLGTRATLDRPAAREKLAALLASLGRVRNRPIRLAPFLVERFGVEFGFMLRAPEARGDQWHVTVEPGNYMAFFAPWSSGDYDT